MLVLVSITYYYIYIYIYIYVYILKTKVSKNNRLSFSHIFVNILQNKLGLASNFILFFPLMRVFFFFFFFFLLFIYLG